MPATDFQGATSSFGTFGRSLLSIRRDQVHSMDSPAPGASSLDSELETFQKHVAERLNDLLTADSSELLSIPWIRKLLDVFLYCQDEFRVLIFNNRAYLNRPPMDRYVSEYFERSVKALDVCNAIRDGIENIRSWQKQVEIVLCALDGHKSFGEGHFRRAKKALTDLALGMLDEKDGNAHAHRNRSFGRQTVQRDQKSLSHFRSLSWSVSRSWSAARQLQAIGNNLVAPRANEVMATNGLAVAVYTMSYLLLFVMWALVAAIPCQDRGLGTHFSVTRQYIWAVPIVSLHERILEESRKRDRRNSCGLLQEIHEIGKCARLLDELADSVKFPLTVEKGEEIRQKVQKLGVVYEAVKDGLDPLERQVREVFHRIVRSRTEGLDTMGGANSHT